MDESTSYQNNSKLSTKTKASLRHSLETDLKRSFNFGFLKKKSSQGLYGSNSLFLERPQKENLNTSNQNYSSDYNDSVQKLKNDNQYDGKVKSNRLGKKKQSVTAQQLKNNISKENNDKYILGKQKQKGGTQYSKSQSGSQNFIEQNKNYGPAAKHNLNLNLKSQNFINIKQQPSLQNQNSGIKSKRTPREHSVISQTQQTQAVDDIGKNIEDLSLEDKVKALKSKNLKSNNQQDATLEPSEQLSSSQQYQQDHNSKQAKNKNRLSIVQNQFLDKSQAKQLVEQTNRKQQIAMSAEEAISKHGGSITIYERSEIVQYSQIYYCGQNADKVGCQSSQDVHGFDDNRGEYIPLVHDHLAYRFEILGILGRGSFGSVFKCYDHKQGCTRAVKVVRNRKRLKEQGMVEVGILDHIRRKDSKDVKNVVRMMQSFWFREHLCISFEMLQDNMYELIKMNNFQGISLGHIKTYAYQVVVALKFLRQQQIIHCDLKPENIMLKIFDNKSIKIIDFGEDESEQMQCMMEIIGLPPQSMIKKSSRHKLFFSNCNSQAPLLVPNSRGKVRQPSSKSMQKAVKSNDKSFISFLQGCLKWRPQDRLSPEEALEHPFLRDISHGHKHISNEVQQQQGTQHSLQANEKQSAQQKNQLQGIGSKFYPKHQDSAIKQQQNHPTQTQPQKIQSNTMQTNITQEQNTYQEPIQIITPKQLQPAQQQQLQIDNKLNTNKGLNPIQMEQEKNVKTQNRISHQSSSITPRFDVNNYQLQSQNDKNSKCNDVQKIQNTDNAFTMSLSKNQQNNTSTYNNKNSNKQNTSAGNQKRQPQLQQNQTQQYQLQEQQLQQQHPQQVQQEQQQQEDLEQQQLRTQAEDYQSLLTLVKQASSEQASQTSFYHSQEEAQSARGANNESLQTEQIENSTITNTQPNSAPAKKDDQEPFTNKNSLMTQQIPRQGAKQDIQRYKSDNWVSQQQQGVQQKTDFKPSQLTTKNGERTRKVKDDIAKARRDAKNKEKQAKIASGQRNVWGKLANNLSDSFFLSKSRNAQTRTAVTRNATSRNNQPNKGLNSEIKNAVLSSRADSNQKKKEKNAIHLSFFTPRKGAPGSTQEQI